MCVYLRVYMHEGMRILAYMLACIHVRMCVCVYVCMCIFVCVWVYVVVVCL